MPASYDENMPSEPIRILKSALPYLGAPVRHQVSLALKCMELQDILQAPSPTPENSSMMRGNEENESPSSQNTSEKRLQMLQSIRGACDPEHIGYVDTVIQTFRMQSMIQQIPSAPPSPASHDAPVIPFLRKATAENTAPADEGSLETRLKSMLSPQQQALFQSVSQMLKQPEVAENRQENEAAHG